MVTPEVSIEEHRPDPLDEVRWPVRTDRLVIRRATAEDLDATWAFRRLPEVAEWMTTATQDVEEYRARFLSDTRLPKTLVFEHDGVVVGDLMLAVKDAWAQAEVEEQGRHAEAELGWCIHPAHGGRGLATEAARALLGISFDQLQVHRAVALCFADNVPSWRIMERLGMRREAHTRRDGLHRTRGWLDGYVYALLDEEWRTQHP